MVKVSRRSDGGKSTKMSFKNVRYGSQKTVSNHLKSAFFSRPREKWHMMEKMPILIFRPEVPYDESINVVYFLGSQLSVFSRKFSKTASSAHRRKMPEINAASTDTKTLPLDIAEGSRIF